MPLRIAYFVNQYPAVSHTFIRREILALERQGVEVLRIALRGEARSIDPQNESERLKTRYVLAAGLIGLVASLMRVAITAPHRFLASLILAGKMARRSDRGLALHMAYLAEAARIVPWLAAFGAQHVHAHFGTNSAEIAMLSHELGGPPYSFTVHGPDEFDRPQLLGLADKVRRAAFVVAISSFCRSQLYRWVDYEHWKKIHVVHCGLDSEFLNAEAQSQVESPRLVCVGRISEQKGHFVLIDAAECLLKKGLQFEVVLVGDGEMRRAIEARIQQAGLARHVRVTGWLNGQRVREELQAARGLVLASFAEGLPVVVMEAMALRKPVISTFVGGLPELVRPGREGWLVPAGSVEDLAAVMEEFLTCSAERLASMGEAAYRRVLTRHSVDNEVSKLIPLFARGGRSF